jgi:hypothetical protein
LDGIARDERVERGVLAIGRVARSSARRVLAVVLRQEREQLAQRPAGSRLVGEARCATPERAACVCAPPSSSFVTSSCVTARMTSGP